MIISKKKKFVFVSVPKTGSTSIERVLVKYQDTVAMIPDKKHVPFRLIDLPYFKFCFFRNPWDQFVSLYEYRKARQEHMGNPLNVCFDEWVENPILSFEHHLRTEYEFILDEHGFVIPNIKVYKYEDIYESWGDICKRLNITDKLPHYNKSRHQHYSTYYTDKTKHIIARKCWREIEMMEYEFHQF